MSKRKFQSIRDEIKRLEEIINARDWRLAPRYRLSAGPSRRGVKVTGPTYAERLAEYNALDAQINQLRVQLPLEESEIWTEANEELDTIEQLEPQIFFDEQKLLERQARELSMDKEAEIEHNAAIASAVDAKAPAAATGAGVGAAAAAAAAGAISRLPPAAAAAGGGAGVIQVRYIQHKRQRVEANSDRDSDNMSYDTALAYTRSYFKNDLNWIVTKSTKRDLWYAFNIKTKQSKFLRDIKYQIEEMRKWTLKTTSK